MFRCLDVVITSGCSAYTPQMLQWISPYQIQHALGMEHRVSGRGAGSLRPQCPSIQRNALQRQDRWVGGCEKFLGMYQISRRTRGTVANSSLPRANLVTRVTCLVINSLLLN